MRRTMLRLATILVAGLLLNGCLSLNTPPYLVSHETDVALRATGATGIAVGPFTSTVKDIDYNCRLAATITPSDQIEFKDYIRDALISELTIAGIYDERAPRVTLTGVLTGLDVSATDGLVNGNWAISLQVTSSNGKSVSAATHYAFPSHFFGDVACRRTARAFLPAVQDLIGTLVKQPEFKTLLVPADASAGS